MVNNTSTHFFASSPSIKKKKSYSYIFYQRILRRLWKNPFYTLPLLLQPHMATRRLSKSAASAAIRAYNTFSRPSLLLRSRAISASGHHFTSISSPNSFLLRPNSSIGAITSHGQPLPLPFQFLSPRRLSATAAQVRGSRKFESLVKRKCVDFVLSM